MVELTNVQLWALPILTLIVCIAGLIVSILAYTQSSQLSSLGPSNSVQTIKSANGFAGVVQDTVATVKTNNVSGILSATSGALSTAKSTQLINAKLTDVQVNSSSARTSLNVTPSTRILDFFERALYLNQTTLGEEYFPQRGQIVSSDTLFRLLEKAQGNITGTNSNYFCNCDSFSEGIRLRETNIWSPSFLIPTTPENFWQGGTTTSIFSSLYITASAVGAGEIIFRMVVGNGSENKTEFRLALQIAAASGTKAIPLTVIFWSDGINSIRYQANATLSPLLTAGANTGRALSGVIPNLDLSKEVNFECFTSVTGVNQTYNFNFTVGNYLFVR